MANQTPTMVPSGQGGIRYKHNWQNGHLELLDRFKPGDPQLGVAIATYTNRNDTNRQSHHWARALNWIENILFGSGRHYIDGILATRLASNTDSSGQDLRLVRETVRSMPRPVNDLLGRYIETNIALLTENRPMPRVTPKSDRIQDIQAAELSELTLQYLWEALNLPFKHRELARILMYCGTAWLEVFYDPTKVRRLQAPAMEERPVPMQLGGSGPVIPTEAVRQFPQFDEFGAPVFTESPEFGDITCRIVSPFEMHFPNAHYWDSEELSWVIKESFMPIETFKDMYKDFKKEKGISKRNGWHLDRIKDVKGENVRNIPLWWWERLSHLIEGAGPTLNIGTPDQWEDHVVIKVFDRKPNERWPRGRTVIVAGDQVIYDSPKAVGARAYDPRWPDRWHPYVKYSWEGMVGNIYSRSLVSKLLPKIKRVNAIDTTLIMWRRTVPISSWIIPTGTQVIEDFWQGGAGRLLEFDARRTMQMKPEPVFAPPFPDAALKEREFNIAEMEAISGTEEILRGQRPVGVNCWAPDSFLTDANGMPIKVEDIVIGDEHMSVTGKGPIGATHTNYQKGKLLTIKSWGNLSATITPNHKFYVLPGSAIPKNKNGRRKKDRNTGKGAVPSEAAIIIKTANELKIKDLLLAGFFKPRDGWEKLDLTKYSNKGRTTLPPYIKIDEDLLWLFGIYLAEGLIGNYKTTPTFVRFTLAETELAIANKITAIVKTVFNIHTKCKRLKDKRKAMIVDINNRAVAALFMDLFSTGSSNKYICKDLFRTPKSLLSLVSGWLDGDGSKDGNSLRGTTISLNLASQIRSILLDERCYARITKCSARQQNYKDQYTLTLSGDACNRLAINSVRWNTEVFKDTSKGYRGFWIGNYYASYIHTITESEYDGPVYNVTMDDRTGCDNSVNSFGLFSLQSAAMIDVLRKQALASRSAILQNWDESIQHLGSSLLQETIRHIREDDRYLDRVKLLAREKHSRLTIKTFSGVNLSDNVQVRVDTASQALVSKEAREAKALEFIQYASGLMALPVSLRQALVEELGFAKGLTPQGPDVDRAKRLIGWIHQREFNKIVPIPEDDPYVISELLINELKSDIIYDMDEQQFMALTMLIDQYRQMIQAQEEEALQIQLMMAQAGAANEANPPDMNEE